MTLSDQEDAMRKMMTGPFEFEPYRPWSDDRRATASARVHGREFSKIGPMYSLFEVCAVSGRCTAMGRFLDYNEACRAAATPKEETVLVLLDRDGYATVMRSRPPFETPVFLQAARIAERVLRGD